MLSTQNAVFERSIIFIPKWLEKRVQAFSKTNKTLKDIDGLFSILTPADVSFYLEQVETIAQLPAVRPYFQTFKMHSHVDSATWGGNISNKRAAKRYNQLIDIIQRGNEANNPNNFSPIESYVENNAALPNYAEKTEQLLPIEKGNDRLDLAAILGVDANNPDIDLVNLRVVLNELDADTLILRLETIDPDQNKFAQVLEQTESNINKITQYYEFNKVMATQVGKYYCRLVLASPNT